jgi:outer membrane protein assembly factor BamA
MNYRLQISIFEVPLLLEMDRNTTKYQLIFLLLCFWCSTTSAQVDNPTDSTESRYVTIDNVFIIGNKKTKASIILRELSVKKGMLIYYPDLIKHLDTDQNKIYNTRLFNTVKVNTLDLSTDQVDVVIQVEERWYTYPIPVFKLADRNLNDWLKNQGGDFSRVNYGLKFSQYNLRGRNEKLRLNAQFGFTKNYYISYKIPYIDRSQKNGLEIKVGYKENKSAAYITEDHRQVFNTSEDIQFRETYGLVSYTRRSQFYDFHDVVLEFNNSRISDSLNILNPRYFSNRETQQQYLALRYKFTRDKRDVIAYPLKGYRIQVGLNKIGLGIYNELDIIDLRVTHDRYLEVGKNMYFSVYTKAVISTPDNQSYKIFPSLGRQQDFVRGYELYLIEGSGFVLNKMSFKRVLFKGVKQNPMKVSHFKNFPYALYLKTYFDMGYVDNFNNYEMNDRLTNRLIYGTGIGLDFVTFYDFVIRTEYSINDEKEHGFFFHFRKGF